MNDAPTTGHVELFARDGHLTMLTLDRFDAGELGVDAFERVIDHVRGCSLCSDRLEDVQDEPRVEIRPPRRGTPQRRPAVVAAASALAAAALLLLFAWPRAEQASRIDDEPELTASAYSTTAAVTEEAQSRSVQLRAFAGDVPLHPRDVVPSDLAVRIDVSAVQPGWIAVFTLEDAEEDEGGTGGLIQPTLEVVLESQSTAELVGGAVELQLEGTGPGADGYDASTLTRLVAVYCPDPFEVAPSPNGFEVEGSAAPDSCESVALELTRTSNAADS